VAPASQQGPWFTELKLSASVSQLPFWILLCCSSLPSISIKAQNKMQNKGPLPLENPSLSELESWFETLTLVMGFLRIWCHHPYLFIRTVPLLLSTLSVFFFELFCCILPQTGFCSIGVEEEWFYTLHGLLETMHKIPKKYCNYPPLQYAPFETIHHNQVEKRTLPHICLWQCGVSWSRVKMGYMMVSLDFQLNWIEKHLGDW
jgi:hypothetical protein